MVCKCINPDGTPTQYCTGSCTVLKPVVDDPLNGFAELILSQVDKRIEHALDKFHIKIEKEISVDYRDIFLEGFKEGLKFAREENERY